MNLVPFALSLSSREGLRRCKLSKEGEIYNKINKPATKVSKKKKKKTSEDTQDVEICLIPLSNISEPKNIKKGELTETLNFVVSTFLF